MASYISSNENRFYTALEESYGRVGTVTQANRIPALRLAVKQQRETAERKDKTGSRTFPGQPPGGRLRTDFELRTYLTSWQKAAGEPAYGPLFRAALGGEPARFQGGTTASATGAGRVTLAQAHGLAPGQAVACAGEIRFVEAVVDELTVQLNAPFTMTPAAGTALDAAVTYGPATELPSVSLFDYWSPGTAVQRLLCGAAVGRMDIAINGDFHEFHFKGPAQDVLDTSSFQTGEAGELTAFPEEPVVAALDYSPVPGNMGQAWLGSSPEKIETLLSASVVVDNSLDTRAHEFGWNVPRAISPGRRSVTAEFELFSLDDAATKALYQAARQQSPIGVMFQLGEADGQLMGVYLKSVIPEVPEFNDSRNRLAWRFRGSHAQGSVDDEIAVAFA